MNKLATPDLIYSDLFDAVQGKHLFGDSKTFVDALPKGDAKAIVAEYLAVRENADFDLREFVEANFELPIEDSERLHSDGKKPIRDHIETMWDVLTRAKDEAKPYSSLVALPYPYLVPGGRFREIYYWDSYFPMLGLAGSGRTQLIEHMVANFAYLIDEIGFIPNGNRTYYCTRSQPPLFALMVELLAQVKEDQAVYRQYLPQLQSEYRFWMAGAETLAEDYSATRRVIKVGDGYLNRYWDDSVLPRQESFEEDVELVAHSQGDGDDIYRDIRAGAESGWDYSSRWFADGTKMGSIHTTQVVPIDLNTLLYQLESVLALAYADAGEPDQQALYISRAQCRREAIQSLFFNPEVGMFSDLLLPDLRPSPRLSLASVYPLVFRLATKEQAAQVAANVQADYLKAGGWVTTLTSSGQQWDAPNGWAPLQWFTYLGLSNYGYRTEAELGARRWIENNLQVYRATGALLEKYNVEELGKIAGGGEYEVQDGFGWTNGVLLRLMDELD